MDFQTASLNESLKKQKWQKTEIVWWNQKQGYGEHTSEIIDANAKQLCKMCSSAVGSLAF